VPNPFVRIANAGTLEAFHVRASADDDCNPDNDTYELPAPIGMRTLCSVK